MKLALEIEKTFNRKIKYPKDCSDLSTDIANITNRNISSSTLRRIFGLLKSQSSISKYNKETLKFYLEEKKRLAKKLNNLNLSFKNDVSEEEFRNLKTLHNGLNEGFITELVHSQVHPHKVLKLFQLSILEAINSKNIEYILSIYRNYSFVFSNPQFVRFLGNELNAHEDFRDMLLPKLAKIKNARRYFFELFIDFGNFKEFQKWLKIYFQNEPDYLNKLWALSLLIFGNKLSNKKETNWESFFEILDLCEEKLESAHPYLKARVYCVGLMSERRIVYFENKITQELNESKLQSSFDPSFFPHFACMACHHVFMTDINPNIFTSIYEAIVSYKSKKPWHNESSFSFFKLIFEAILNNSSIDLNTIKIFHSGHTNDDLHFKLFALKFVTNPQQQKETKIYKEQLIEESGFTYFSDK